MCESANVQLRNQCQCESMPICKCASMRMYKIANVQVCNCASVQICMYVSQCKVLMGVSSLVWARDLWRSALFFLFLLKKMVFCFEMFWLLTSEATGFLVLPSFLLPFLPRCLHSRFPPYSLFTRLTIPSSSFPSYGAEGIERVLHFWKVKKLLTPQIKVWFVIPFPLSKSKSSAHLFFPPSFRSASFFLSFSSFFSPLSSPFPPFLSFFFPTDRCATSNLFQIFQISW